MRPKRIGDWKSAVSFCLLPLTLPTCEGSQKLALGAVATGATGLSIHHNTKDFAKSQWSDM